MSTPGALPSERSVLRRLGVASWSWLGILALAAVVVLALSAVAGLVVPFVVAVVVAALLVPLVDALERRGVPRVAGALLVLAGFLLVVVLVAALSVAAVVSQWSVVTADLGDGLRAFSAWLEERGVEVASPVALLRLGLGFLGGLAAGPTSAVAGALASATAFLVGTGIALFLLFLLLTDWPRLVGWLSQRLWLPADVGAGVVEDVLAPLRSYYVALTLSSAIVSVVIALAAWLLGVPLALAIGVVTFVTSYVPYLGAIASGAFAVLVAWGAAGPTEALVLLLVVLAVQNVVQSVVQAKLTGAALDLHPVVTFSATIVGAAVAGVLGASLAVPVVAAVRRVVARLRTWRDGQVAAS
ncbi:AI-2E family transporter [Aquipuribacter sp. SD81]|uniref:AI-2E family transporter n=1 Tax=Aquipuribacter sp. SD81 TaxID=3127703 RepID=UPI003018A90D